VPKMPKIKGMDSFQGTLMHSAKYDEKLVLKGKRLAVIGSGSSGIQLIAEIRKDVKGLYT
jgi:cation diffusion facilitator CzcD-associated flavoprotein CzcO